MIRWQSKTPVPYEALTAEMRKEICNGCGGKGGIVKPPHRVFFRASCDHHDYAYSCGGGPAARLRADKMLYRLMMKDCDSLPWFKRMRYRPWCWAYYQGVRLAGNIFFYPGRKRWPKI